jgi:hypothetical protein
MVIVKLKTFSLVSIVSSLLILGWCRSTASFELEVERTQDRGDGTTDTIRGGVKGSVSSGGSLLRPVAELIASVSGYSYEDWQGVDFSEFEIELDGQFGVTSTINGNAVEVMIISANSVLSKQTFPIIQIGETAKFSNPNAVKSWSLQYVDIAEEVKFEFTTTTVNVMATPSSMNIRMKDGNSVLASKTVNYGGNGCNAENMDPDVGLQICQ